MKTSLKTGMARLVAAGLLAALGAAAANAELISAADLNAGFARAAAELAADRTVCEPLVSNPRGVCCEQALARPQ